ncbi:type II toxin-antitoxin system RelE/ParE family toxin [Rhizobium sp. CSW-27]|uniref:type II toxin-antitoxin system RelE/ParE family toxin n=1 Tax=Rhizobium sp. CSW-27 TaxID=2839985 RepID=UPI001C0342B1|nr:type II toxin-antitoxin system RelE/ParE family toxin [Rhizobium sp. CSW-27]
MRRLEWRQTARSDLLSIIDYISDHNSDAAQALKDEIDLKVGRLIEHPRLYRAGRVEGTREMVVRSNYVVIYREDESAVSILRVLHAAQQWPPEAVRGE